MSSNFAPGQGGLLTGLQALSGYGTPNFAPPAGPPTAVPALQTPAYNYQGGIPRVPIGGQFNQLTQQMAGPIYSPLGSTWNAQLPAGTQPTPGGMPSIPGQNTMPVPRVNTPAPAVHGVPPPMPYNPLTANPNLGGLMGTGSSGSGRQLLRTGNNGFRIASVQ